MGNKEQKGLDPSYDYIQEEATIYYPDASSGDHSTAVFAADFNGDGYCDIAATNDYPDYVNILLGADNGTFDFYGSNRVGGLPKSIAIADFNGDSIVDLATPGNGDSNASVLLGNGGGSFQSSMYFPAGIPLWDICAGDCDLDGDFDLAVLWGYRISILLNTTINLLGTKA